MHKRNRSGGLLAAGFMAGILVLAGCTDVLQGPSASLGSTGEGRVTITIDGGARTVLPPAEAFSRFEVTIAQQGGTQELNPVEATGGSAELVLPVGSWDVQVWAYNQAEPVVIVAQAANTLTNTAGEITGNTRFVLEPTGTGPGVLAYRITKPEGSVLDGDQSRIQIEQNGSTVKTIGFSDSVAGETNLEPGRYIVDLLLAEGNTGKQAAQRETVVILPGLTTEVNFTPAEFLAAMDTLTFSSIADFRAYVAALPINTADTPYRVRLIGIALEDLQEGGDPLGQVFSALGPKRWSDMTAEERRDGRYIALDLSGCTGTAIGTVDPSVTEPKMPAEIDANILHRQRVVSLTLPQSLEIIGDFAFQWFSGLKSVVLPESLKVIGHWGFYYSGLTSVEIPDSVERIGVRAFGGGGAGKLMSVKLSASLKEIPYYALSGHPFSSIELPHGLEVIGEYAFSSLNTELRSIHFPDTLTTIEHGAFAFTEQLESITLPASLTTLEGSAFRGSGVKSVDLSACVNLEKIGDGIGQEILHYAFAECPSLTEVKLPPNLKVIGWASFLDCGQLKVLDLPASVEHIYGRSIFGVSTLIVRSLEPPRVTPYMEESFAAQVIYVPDESIEAYKADTGLNNKYEPGWSKYAQRFRPLSEYHE